MANVSINCNDSECSAEVLTIDNTRDHFIKLEWTDGVTMYLHGYNREAIAHARTLAAQLTEAAAEVERLMATTVATEVVSA